MQLRDTIHADVFALHPGFCWGKVLCWDFDNTREVEPAERDVRLLGGQARWYLLDAAKPWAETLV